VLLRAEPTNVFSLQQKLAIRNALHKIVLYLDCAENSDLKKKVTREVELISDLISLAPQPPPEQTQTKISHNRA
jgi:hypothetical protein